MHNNDTTTTGTQWRIAKVGNELRWLGKTLQQNVYWEQVDESEHLLRAEWRWRDVPVVIED